MSAEYKAEGNIAVITLTNPPVNGLGFATRHAIVEGMKLALNDDAITAIIITGAGKAFSGGADIKEFNSPKAFAEPSLHTVINVIESAEKPVIALFIAFVWEGAGIGIGLPLSYCQPRCANRTTRG